MGHPHLRDCLVGFSGCGVDTLGHGTAVAAAICDLAGGVWIHSIGALDASGRCSADRIVEALDESIGEGVDLINLSIGVMGIDLDTTFIGALERLSDAGIKLVAPAASDGGWCFPGCMSGVEGVVVDIDAARDRPTRRFHEGTELWFASPLPRDLPGLARDRNLQGVSMAVANVTGHLAVQMRP